MATVDPIVPLSQPVAAGDPSIHSAEAGFRQFGFSAAILTVLENSGYSQPTPIQAQTIPLLLDRRDVLGQAQTGTGKTAAFALPALERLEASLQEPQVLVLTPTRELAIQVADSFEKYSAAMHGVQIAPIYGGQDYQVQFRKLKRAQIVVGTPGRVMDHLRRGSLQLDSLRYLVLDEADEMLRMGFADDVQWVLNQSPSNRQMALFSATMPQPIREIARRHMNDPAEVTIAQKAAAADTINQRYIITPPKQKQSILARILEAEDTDGVLVFVKTRSTTGPVADYLCNHGFKAAALTGDHAQSQRERIVESLRSGRTDIIVATDVAARGLDVSRVSHVINYDLPYDSEAYVHRIGRTGRAGRSGEAILFVHPRERRSLQRLEHATRNSIQPMDPPSNRQINKQRVARFHERITEGLANSELETFKSVVEQYQRENDVPLELIAASLALLANGKRPLLEREHIKQTSFPEPKSHSKSERNCSRRGKNRDGNTVWDADVPMETFRVAVGREHKIQPGNLVGAIANETGLGSEMIGRIKIFDRFSLVDLPQGIPAELLELLKTVIVGGRPLRISRDRPVESHQHSRKRKPGFHKSKAKQVRPRKRKK